MKFSKNQVVIFYTCLFFYFFSQEIFAWGFHAHKLINKNAVFLLFEEDLFAFYKRNIFFISEKSVNPDKRRLLVKGEAEKHFIDLDFYGKEQINFFVDSRDKSLYLRNSVHGIVTWNICKMKKLLTEAFLARDTKKIVKISTDLGHYIGDLNVPLHTTKNYDGQQTNQKGIHAFCESRLPELFSHQYNFVVGKAEYIKDLHSYVWQAVLEANGCLDNLLNEEKILEKNFFAKKYSFEAKGNVVKKVYSYEYSQAYDKRIRNILEGQMQKSIKMVASIWYTAWVDAGKPAFFS